MSIDLTCPTCAGAWAPPTPGRPCPDCTYGRRQPTLEEWDAREADCAALCRALTDAVDGLVDMVAQ